MQSGCVLVVEDDPRIGALLDHGLARAGYRVRLASDGHAALAEAHAAAPDIVVLDVSLPGLDGLEVARRLRAESSVPILMLSARDGLDDRIRGLEAGADDYLGKPFAFAELVARLQALRRGRALAVAATDRGVLGYADVRMDLDTHQAWRGERPLTLRNKTFQLLAYLLRQPERVVSRRELLEAVWGYQYDDNVVEVTIGHLRKSLEAHGEPRLIQTVRPVGYTLRVQRDWAGASA